MKINIKNLIKSILIPVLGGMVIGFLIKGNIDYNNLNKPFLSPPSLVFPIVWFILYILMGISSYLILQINYKSKSLLIYRLQLVVNLLWSILFFTLKLRLLSLIWLFMLIILVIKMIKEFYELNKISALIQIPYLIWLTFAFYLNAGIYFLNK